MSNLIGVTETYDPFYVEGWEQRLLDANIIITKHLSDGMIDTLIKNKDRIILHHTVTGQGGTILEPNVPSIEDQHHMMEVLMMKGFPRSHYVLRLDPIIPINKDTITNVIRVLDLWSIHVKTIQETYPNYKMRCRVSIIDLYPHVLSRFDGSGVRLHWRSFHAPENVFKFVEDLLRDYYDYFHFECCAEYGFSDGFIKKVGCASHSDIMLLGLNMLDYKSPDHLPRAGCCCLSKKNILGVKPGRCPHKCLYCYWKD